jgi:hypothetical protein
MAWRGDIEALLAQEPESLGSRCPYCGAALDSSARVCDACGEDVAALIHRPALPEVYYREARGRYAAGDPGGALESILLNLRLRPRCLPAIRLAAGLSALEGQLAQADDWALRAATLAPEDSPTQALCAAVTAARESRGAGQAARRPAASAAPALRSGRAASRATGAAVSCAALLGGMTGLLLSLLARRRRGDDPTRGP